MSIQRSWTKVSLSIIGYTLAIAIISITLSLTFVAPAIFQQPAIYVSPSHLTVTQPTRVSTTTILRAGLPLRIRIPTITVNAAIEYVGLTSAGAMDIKPNPDDVAWYQLGSRPGEKGSAVIAGHYGWDHEKASVFTDLSRVQLGDVIYIDNDKKTTISFVVRGTQRYNPNADATTIFRSNDGKSHLNLITCDGTWNAAKQTYSNRLVVFSDQV